MYIQFPKIVNEWLAEFFAITLLTFGVPLFFAGLYIVFYGGSFYCCFMGGGLSLSGILVMRRLPEGVFLYLLTWLVACCWIVMSEGNDMIEILPWLVVPGVLVVPAIMVLPTLYRIKRESKKAEQDKKVA